jgi:NAD(P)-dependent dehydrogenase (short-subunit alcohol dehydrogenase family)
VLVNTPFAGRTALVLGASRGIGAATARLFALRGARVVLASRDVAALERLADEIRSRGGDALVAPVDLADPSSIHAMGQALAAAGPHLDYAFNNAGDGHPPTPLAEVPDEAFVRVLATTVTGTFLAMKEEIPLMLRDGGHGAIVNMASTAGVSAFPGGGPYIAAKHAIIGLTKSAAIDYAVQGVRVKVVAPGPIETERLARMPEEYRERTRQAVPMRRMGRPEEVGEAVLWLCGEASRFLTGTTVFVDGGRMAGFA